VGICGWLAWAAKAEMSKRQQSRSRFEITRQFTAYAFQGEGEVSEDPYVLKKGEIVLADLDFGNDKPLEGALIMRFLYEDKWFYVERETFVRSTRKTAPPR
jgi:hypothetical protein